jgi:hypothetical protein
MTLSRGDSYYDNIYPNDGSKSVAAVVVSTLHIMIPIYFNFNCNVLHSCQLPRVVRCELSTRIANFLERERESV